MDYILVRAVDNSDQSPRLVQMCHEHGPIIPGVYVGRTSDRKIIPEGVVVPKTSHWLNKVKDGDLVLLKDPAPLPVEDAPEPARAAKPSESAEPSQG